MKRGMSQIIGSLLLVVMVVAMALIIGIWSKSMIGETITIHGQTVTLVCNDIFFEFSYNSGVLSIINSGNVDIHSIKLVIYTEDNSEVVDIKDLTSKWPENGLTQGGVFSDSISFDADVKEVHLFPILQGDTESGKQKEHVCEYEGHIIEPN